MASILIVEDDVHQMRLLSMWLRRNGHDVTAVRGGEEAQALLSVELIISDVNMPNVDGIELVNWIRNERRLDVPVLMLSSRCDQAELTERLAGCATRVLPKPFSPSRLVMEIENLLERRAAPGASESPGEEDKGQTETACR
jgi:DNA-binding response OmpR family regulator